MRNVIVTKNNQGTFTTSDGQIFPNQLMAWLHEAKLVAKLGLDHSRSNKNNVNRPKKLKLNKHEKSRTNVSTVSTSD
jgi:hypothetical protein